MNLSKKYPALFRLCKGAGACVVILYFLISLLVFYQFSEHIFNYASNFAKFSSTPSPKIAFEPGSLSTSAPNVTTKAGMKFQSPDPSHSHYLACRMPQLEPFSKSFKMYLEAVNVEEEKEKTKCDKIYPKLFESTLEGNIVPVDGAKSLGYRTCCYQKFQGGKTWGYSIETSPTCHPLSLQNETKIPQDNEFVEILCEKMRNSSWANETVDLHSFIRVKPEVEKKLNKVLRRDKRQVNVVVFGIDAYSRMAFYRFMPKSLAYLKELEAIEMTGYNKVEDNTYPCIIPLLINRHLLDASHSCARWGFYDDCPFIWKSYAEKGYRTSYAEDYTDMNMFGGGGPVWGGHHSPYGLEKSPTHYDFKPYAYHAKKKGFPHLCYGPRLSFKVMLDNIKKLMYQMDKINKPYFQFTWSNALTHDLFTTGRYGDEPLLDMLKWMKNSGKLKQTLFILMGDHGWRFGAFRNSYEGQQEQKLPLLFLILPDWMKEGNYSRAFQNLLINRDRLVTVFDLHQVFLDILNLEGIQNEQIAKREVHLSNTTIPRGISLFLPIPTKRTCEMADIAQEYCACKPLSNIEPSSSAATTAALVSLQKINSIISNSSHCSNLSLSSVIKAGYDWKGKSYQVNFQTEPGNATFEAIVRSSGLVNGTLEVTGTITRTNKYGNQSHCVQDRFIKSYCYCI